jgi:hypothetical protein
MADRTALQQLRNVVVSLSLLVTSLIEITPDSIRPWQSHGAGCTTSISCSAWLPQPAHEPARPAVPSEGTDIESPESLTQGPDLIGLIDHAGDHLHLVRQTRRARVGTTAEVSHSTTVVPSKPFAI